MSHQKECRCSNCMYQKRLLVKVEEIYQAMVASGKKEQQKDD